MHLLRPTSGAEQALNAFDALNLTDIVEQRIETLDVLHIYTDRTLKDSIVRLHADSTHIYAEVGCDKFR